MPDALDELDYDDEASPVSLDDLCSKVGIDPHHTAVDTFMRQPLGAALAYGAGIGA